MRKDVTSLLVNDNVYHIVSRSIARYQIFNNDGDYSRMIKLFSYYNIQKPPTRFSMFLRLKGAQEVGFDPYFNNIVKDQERLLDIIAYCLMPNHIHLVLKQLQENGTSIFMNNVLNSYTRYFNLLHKRKGPLWESRFKRILVEKDEQLLHLTRYVHLNPCSADLVNKPELWKYSSYLEFIKPQEDRTTSYESVLEINPKNYRKFVNDRKDYQRRLSIIKKTINI